MLIDGPRIRHDEDVRHRSLVLYHDEQTRESPPENRHLSRIRSDDSAIRGPVHLAEVDSANSAVVTDGSRHSP